MSKKELNETEVSQNYVTPARVDELMGLLDRLEARRTTTRTVLGSFTSAAVHHLDA